MAPPPGKPIKPPKQGKSRRKLFIIIGVVLLLTVAAVAAFIFLKPHKADAPSTTTETTTSPQVAPDQNSASAEVTKYTSPATALNLNFSYPKSWTADPPTNTGDATKSITVTSPKVTITTAENTTATGRVIISIRPPSVGLTELSGSKTAIAAQDSLQFAYTAPTSAQHQYPYLTFMHFSDGSKVDGAFQEVIITGVTSFKKGAVLSIGTIGPVDPFITAAFVKCTTDDCTGTDGTTPLAITNAVWLSADIFKQTQAVFSSLQLN